MTVRNQGEAILSGQSLEQGYGGQPVLQDVSLTLHEGERIGLIGRNGSGKSTLMRILAGIQKPDQGLVTRKQALRVGYLRQTYEPEQGITVGNVLEQAGRRLLDIVEEFNEMGELLADAPLSTGERERAEARHEQLQHNLALNGAWDFAKEKKRVSTALQTPDPDRLLTTLSGGELRRVDLAATILEKPDVLLLDEPTNHIDMESVEWMESFLCDFSGSIVLVTHDRYFLDLIVTRIVEIEFSRVYSFPGNYEQFLAYKTQLIEAEAKAEDSRQGILRRELAWVRRGAKARSTKQKARLDRYDALVDQGPPRQHKKSYFEIPAPPRLGKDILEVEKFSFSYGDNLLFENFSIIMQKDMRVGVVGPNGSGKTTLIRALMGLEERAKGTRRVGETTEFLYIDQTHEEMDPEKSVLDFVSGGAQHLDVNGRRIYVPAYLEKLLFNMDSVRAPMGNLTGGERNRIELAKKLLRGGNFLVLDEPTNDLDLPTLRLLEESIGTFDGCALIVSHDRYFLNRVCTHIVSFQDDGELLLIVGDYDDYLRVRRVRDEGEFEKAATTPRAAATPAPAKESVQKLSYQDKQDLANMDALIETAENEVGEIEALMNEPDFYEQDYERVQAALAECDAAKAEVARLYQRWEDLETRRLDGA